VESEWALTGTDSVRDELSPGLSAVGDPSGVRAYLNSGDDPGLALRLVGDPELSPLDLDHVVAFDFPGDLSRCGRTASKAQRPGTRLFEIVGDGSLVRDFSWIVMRLQ